MIPKRIYYCWLTKDESNPGLPDQYKIAVNQWKSIAKQEDGWEYILVDWDYMKTNYGEEVLSEMRNLAQNRSQAVIADYCRLVVTVTKGGFYMDLDTIITPKFLELVKFNGPAISRRPGIDLQFMCHPGGVRTPMNIAEGRRRYRMCGRMIVGNYTFFCSSRDHNYLRERVTRELEGRINGEFEIIHIRDFNCPGQPHTVAMRFFYFNQPLFHFDFNDHDGTRLGFEEEFKRWESEFLEYYNSHHDDTWTEPSVYRTAKPLR